MIDFFFKIVEIVDFIVVCIFEMVEKQNGFVLNFFVMFVNVLFVFEVYMMFVGVIGKCLMLMFVEQQVVFIFLSIENGCDYCVVVYLMIGVVQQVLEDVFDVVCQQCFFGDECFEVV